MSFQPNMERVATSKELSDWKRGLSKALKRGSRKAIQWAIEDGEFLGVPPDHPDLINARRALESTPAGEGTHPSRTEIAGLEPAGARWAEGALSKAAVTGDTRNFENAMGRFVEVMVPSDDNQQRGRESSSNSSSCSTAETEDPPMSESERQMVMKKVVDDIWRFADIDGNGLMSESEARETLRIFLSRPQLRKALGEPLKDMMVKRMAVDSKLFVQLLPGGQSPSCKTTPHQRLLRLCMHSVSRSCADVAKHLPDLTEHFWAAMDVSRNGEVDKEEFLMSFDCAIRNQVVSRISQRAEERAWQFVEAGACDVDTTPEMDGLLRGHIQKKKKEMKAEAAMSMQFPSAKEEAGEICETGCTVM